MSALEQFLGDNPDMAEKPYGDAMAATLYPDVSLPPMTPIMSPDDEALHGV